MIQVKHDIPKSDQTLRAGLRVVDLRKSFVDPRGAKNEVLRGLMFEVDPGESVAIVGASGSGKSTLLHLLGGLENLDHGSINIGETDIANVREKQLATYREKGVGFVFQFHYLLTELTAVENVAMPLLIARLSRKNAYDRALRMLREMGLTEQADYPIGQLSGGEQQRVAVARALIHEPTLLLADEPTGNLDAEISQFIGQILVDYARRNSKISIIATHNESVARLCDRIFELKEGRIYSGV